MRSRRSAAVLVLLCTAGGLTGCADGPRVAASAAAAGDSGASRADCPNRFRDRELACGRTPDGTRVTLVAGTSDGAGPCLELHGLPGGARGCGRAPSEVRPEETSAIGGAVVVRRPGSGRIELYGHTAGAVRRVRITYREGDDLRRRPATLLRVTDRPALAAQRIDRPFGYFAGSVPSTAWDLSADALDVSGRRLGRLRYPHELVYGIYGTAFITRPTPWRPAKRTRRPATSVSIARPVPPRPTSFPPGGTLEASTGSVRLLRVRGPGMNRRDVCLGTAPIGVALVEANVSCAVRVPSDLSVFATVPGQPDRLGPSPTLIFGRVPRTIRRLELRGSFGRRPIRLSAHNAFLVTVASGSRGRLSIVGRGPAGLERSQTFDLPLDRRARLFPERLERRSGAVFGEEVGPPIIGDSARSVRARFGPPAAQRRVGGQPCSFYEVVGAGRRGWRLCFDRRNRVADAVGNRRLP